jgi:hypothetical protein
MSWLFVIFRLYTRLRIVRSAGWDDVFVVLYVVRVLLVLSTNLTILTSVLPLDLGNNWFHRCLPW